MGGGKGDKLVLEDKQHDVKVQVRWAESIMLHHVKPGWRTSGTSSLYTRRSVICNQAILQCMCAQEDG